MSSSVDLPTFEEVEKLLHTKLNSAMQAIAAKFLAGVSTADLAWPITAEGHLNMSIYEITNGRKIWGVVNAASYDSLDDAVVAASAGGVVLIPADTTVTTSGETDFSGLSAIVGAGPSSTIKFTSGAATSLLVAGSGTSMLLSNLTLDGNAEAGTVIGVDLQAGSDVMFDKVLFKDFSSTALLITACTDVFLNLCRFSGGSAGHIKAVKAGRLFLNNCSSDTAGDIAVLVDPASSGDTTVLYMNNVVIDDSVGNAVKVLGLNAPGGSSPVEVHASNVTVNNSSGATAAVILGGATEALHAVTWRGGRLDALSAGGMQVNASNGSISDVVIEDPATFGIDLDVSTYVSVHDCILRGDGAGSTVGIDGSAAGVGCNAHDNVIEGFTAAIDEGSNLTQHDNVGVTPPVTTWVGTSSVVIPAGTVISGGILLIDFGLEDTSLGTTATHPLTLNSQTVLTARAVSHSGTYDYVGRSVIRYSGATTGIAISSGIVSYGSSSDSVANHVVLTSLDWSVDQTLSVTSGGSIVVRYIQG